MKRKTPKKKPNNNQKKKRKDKRKEMKLDESFHYFCLANGAETAEGSAFLLHVGAAAAARSGHGHGQRRLGPVWRIARIPVAGQHVLGRHVVFGSVERGQCTAKRSCARQCQVDASPAVWSPFWASLWLQTILKHPHQSWRISDGDALSRILPRIPVASP